MNEQTGVMKKLGTLQAFGVILAVAGIIGAIAGLMSGRESFMQCYLFAYIFWVGLTLGSLGMTLLHHMIRGRFAMPVLRLFEGGTRNLWLMAILFVPILWAIS